MKTVPKTMLEEVLDGGEFQEAMLTETLRQVRKQKRVRRSRRAIGMVLLVVLGSTLLWTVNHRNPGPAAQVTPKRSYDLIQTRPLPSSMLVLTEASERVIQSSASASLATITSTPARKLEITDQEFWALLNGHPAALVWRNANHPELVFLNPEDRSRLR
jgi:hypothetical protein